ncbi:MAG TPA: hydrogenase [Candidatus Eisenbacteria bacterium]|jgi:Ni,Fe-hydrogenase III small subunit
MWEILVRSLRQGVVTGKSAAPLPADLAPAPRAAEAEIEVLGQALQAEIRGRFRRSMKLRHVDCGSCNGCESELQALLNPFYDLQRFGIDFVASPRHADALMVTGPPALHLEEALRLTDEATPRPRLVVAVGDCACTGGFCAGSFATRRGIEEVLAVDVRIPGCPPRPEAIVRALLKALRG